MQLNVNTIKNIKRFVFLNKINNYTSEQADLPGINMTLSLKYNPRANTSDSFHLYIIKSGEIPNFDVVSSNPAVIICLKLDLLF